LSCSKFQSTLSTNGQQLDREDEIKALNNFEDVLQTVGKLYPSNQAIQYVIEKISSILEKLSGNPGEIYFKHKIREPARFSVSFKYI
jgi:hypothetical protein